MKKQRRKKTIPALLFLLFCPSFDSIAAAVCEQSTEAR